MQNHFIKNPPLKKLLLTLITGLSCIICYSSELYKADSLFKKNKYTQALELYTHVFEKDKAQSPQMLLRMAYIHEGLGQTAEAIYFLNKLQNNNPSTETLQHIESLANSNGLEGHETSDLDRFYIIQPKVFYFTSLLLLVTLLSNLAFLTFKKKQLSPLRLSFILLLIAVAFFTNNFETKREELITFKPTVMYKGPSPASEQLLNIPYGTKLTITEQQDIWSKVFYREQEGFVKRSKTLQGI